MKLLVVMMLALTTCFQVMARNMEIIEIDGYAKVFQKRPNVPLVEFVTLLPGTRLTANLNPRINERRAQGQRLALVGEILNIHRLDHVRFEKALDINEASFDNSDEAGKVRYFIYKSDLRNSRPVDSRPVIIEEPVQRPVVNRPTRYDYDYEVCYEAPRRRYYQAVNQTRRNNGALMTGLGALLGVGGQIAGGRGGDIATGIGIGVAGFGLYSMLTARETFATNDTEMHCRRYYNRGQTRNVDIENQSCVSTHYYSNHWGHRTEYYEVECRGTRFVTFDRPMSASRRHAQPIRRALTIQPGLF